MRFNIERLRLKCDVLRQHIASCNERLDEAIKQAPQDFLDESRLLKYYLLSLLHSFMN